MGHDTISKLAKKMVQLKKNCAYPLLYLLMKLILFLLVATAIVEKVFFIIKISRISYTIRLKDNLINDCLVTYIEKDIFKTIDNKNIIQRFQNMKYRKRLL